MKNRYRLVRGKRSKCEYDVMIFHGETMVFRGGFLTDRLRRLTSDDLKIIQALKAGLETLEHETT